MLTHQLPVRVVTATRLTADEFHRNTYTGQSLNAHASISAFQLRLYPENIYGLSEVYNDAIDDAHSNPALLVFVHDDVFILDFYWEQTIRYWLTQFEVVGIAGNRRRLPFSMMWSLVLDPITGRLREEEKAFQSGAVAHGVFPPIQVNRFGVSGVECALLDGLLIAVDSRVLHRSGVRFDPQFKFHFYDMDFCRSAFQAGLKLGTMPLSVVHASAGGGDFKKWKDVSKLYLDKWGD